MRAVVKIHPRTNLATIAFWAALVLLTASTLLAQDTYFPPAGSWARKTPTEVGMDATKLEAAVQFAQAHETNWPRDFSTQEKIFGTLLGPIPKSRAGTNGLIIRRGYVVAEFGDTNDIAPTYSVAKSMLSTVFGVAVRDGLITNLDEPVGVKVKDGGYESRRNSRITWRNHLQQESEWEGEMWGKKHDFVGAVAFGEAERKPRELQEPGTFYEYNDVRINRLALSLLRLFKKPIPEVFRDEIMNPIGASNTWQWIPYYNAYVDIDRKKMPSISGGTRWGGGVWINAWDMARFGYLWLRGGRWESKQLIPSEYVKAALTAARANNSPDYGFLWWLNTQGRSHPDLPRNVIEAQGAGSNTIFVSPDHDLVIVWRWHGDGKQQFFRQVVDSITEEAPRFQVDPSWPKALPHNWIMGQAAGVAVDARDHIWVIQRPASLTDDEKAAALNPPTSKCCVPAPPVLEFDQAGNVVQAWGGPGEGYDWPQKEHGITIDYKGFVWIGGSGEKDGQYLKFTRDGKFVMQIGKSGAQTSSNDPSRLGGPADADVDPETNEIYIADGYFNHRMIVFDADTGAYKRHWGAYGKKPTDEKREPYNPASSQFGNPVHCVKIAKDGLVYVCDRSNNRIQVFRKNGTFVKEFVAEKNTRGNGSVWDLDFWIDPKQTFLFNADGTNNEVRTLRRESGEIVSAFGRNGRNADEFHWVHNIALDSKGNIYTTEVDTGKRAQRFLYVSPTAR